MTDHTLHPQHVPGGPLTDVALQKTLSRALHGAKCALHPIDGTLWASVTPQTMLESCLALHAMGGVFDSAFTYPLKGKQWAVAYVFRLDQGGRAEGRLIVLYAQGQSFYAVSGKIHSALWDERKMHELNGRVFAMLEDTRPIIAHPENAVWDTKSPRKGAASKAAFPPHAPAPKYEFSGTGEEGEFEIPVGPVHAGIIEPGHFRFFVSGEGINKLEARLSYMHRGIEALAVGKKMSDCFPLIEQVSGDESVANSIAFAQAAESLCGIQVPARAQSLRLILAEQERLTSHLADLGGIAMDVGFSASSSQFAACRESMMRLNEKCFESRFLRKMIKIGGLQWDPQPERISALLAGLAQFSITLGEIERFSLASSTFLDRAFMAGQLTAHTSANLAIVGPGARASGISCDARKHLAYGAYKSVSFNESMGSKGDALSRFMVKLSEIKESVRLIQNETSRMQPGPVCSSATPLPKSGAIALGVSEAARGSVTMFLQAGKGGTISYLGIKTASFRNWRALEQAIHGNIVADFPLINKSFNLSYAGADL